MTLSKLSSSGLVMPSCRHTSITGSSAALKAARAIGPGLYGVDIKETDGAIVVIEVNDNPNLEHGIEDTAGKDEIWRRLLKWFTDRFEQ